MDRMKTAFERAWERAQSLEVGEERISELKYEPEGARLAAQFINEDKFDLLAALTEYPEEVRSYVRQGAGATFLRNISLPKTERQRREAQRAIDGLRLLKRDKSLLSQIWGKMENLFAVYDRERQELYQKLRADFEVQVRQAMQRQGLPANTRINLERSPEFQQRWQQELSALSLGYEERLRSLRLELEKAL